MEESAHSFGTLRGAQANALRSLLVLFGLVVGCGSDPGTDPPTSSESEPALPTLGPCAPGWVSEPMSEASEVCLPWNGGNPPDCPVGSAPRHDGTCARVGTECPSSGFPEGLPSDRPVVYVQAGATNGDGTVAAPFGSLSQTLDQLTELHTVVAVAEGTYPGPIEIPSTVTVWGACVERTVIAGGFPLTVLAAGSESALRNLRVAGSLDGQAPSGPGIWIDTTTMTVEDVVVEGALTAGIAVLSGGSAELRNVHVLNPQPDPLNRGVGFGITVEGSSADLQAVTVRSSYVAGLNVVGDGAEVDATDLTIQDTRLAADGTLGRGLEVRDGAVARISQAVIEGHHGGIHLEGAGTRLALGNAVVRDGRPTTDGRGGRGLNLQDGARANLERVLFERNLDGSVVVLDGTPAALTEIELTDVVIRDSRPRAGNDEFGRGFALQGPARARIVRLLIENQHDLGVYVTNEGAVFEAEDLTVRDTESQMSDGAGGRGIGIQEGATAVITRAHITGNREVGVLVTDASATLAFLRVSGTREAACAESTCPGDGLGDGVLFSFGASGTIRDFVITDNARVGLGVGPDAQVDAERGEIRNHPIGASVQSTLFDPARLGDILFRDNQRNLDRSSLPLAEPSAPLPR